MFWANWLVLACLRSHRYTLFLVQVASTLFQSGRPWRAEIVHSIIRRAERTAVGWLCLAGNVEGPSRAQLRTQPCRRDVGSCYYMTAHQTSAQVRQQVTEGLVVTITSNCSGLFTSCMHVSMILSSNTITKLGAGFFAGVEHQST
jgi:hypothetical protein